jgi:uncharacterized protein YjiS (DUF1127 family)
VSALLPAPGTKPGLDLVYVMTAARRARDARLGRALSRLKRHGADLLRGLAARWHQGLAARRARRELLALDDRQLRDVGLTRGDVARAADDLRMLGVLFTYTGTDADPAGSRRNARQGGA